MVVVVIEEGDAAAHGFGQELVSFGAVEVGEGDAGRGSDVGKGDLGSGDRSLHLDRSFGLDDDRGRGLFGPPDQKDRQSDDRGKAEDHGQRPTEGPSDDSVVGGDDLFFSILIQATNSEAH